MSPHPQRHPASSSEEDLLPDDGPSPSPDPTLGAVRTGLVDDPVTASAWEEEPPRVPVFRWRLVGSAVMVLVVAVSAWWAVTWLMKPSAPESVPVDAQVLSEVGGEVGSEGTGGGESDGDGVGDRDGDAASGGAGPSSGSAGGEAEGGDTGGGDGAGEAPEAGGAGEPADEEGRGDTAEARVRVHVIGEVRSPGVVTVPTDARTADAIAAAGGTTREAQSERINLAAPLVDGQQVLVPGEQTSEEQLESVQAQAHAVAGDVGGGARGGAAAGRAGTGGAGGSYGETGAADTGGAEGPGSDVQESGQDAGTVDLNAADSTALQTLPGVGPATAEKIIAHREQVGPFQSLTDLDAVSGIGPATLERLAPLVTW